MTPPSTITSAANKQEEAIAEQLDNDDMSRLRVPLAMTFDDLLRKDDAPDENADDIIQAVQEWLGTPSQRGID